MPKAEFVGQPFEALGQWTFGHSPEMVFVGTLKYDVDDGLELRVVDTSGRDGFAALREKPENVPVSAVGNTLSHGQISLFNGFLKSKPMSSSGAAESIYFFNGGLLGDAVPDISRPLFKSIFATAPLLRVWLDTPLVTMEWPGCGRAIILRHTLPETIRVTVDDERELLIDWNRDGPTRTIAQADVTISARPWLGLKYRQPVTLQRALREIDSAGRLISLFSGSEFVASLLKLRREEEGDGSATSAYFLASRIRARRRERDLSGRDLLFTFPSVEERFADLIAKWFQIQHEVPSCMNTLFGADNSTYVNQRLFSLTTVIEALHLKFRGHRNWNLSQRLSDYLNTFSPLATEAVGDADGFVRRTVDSRNCEAHCKEGDSGSGSEQSRLSSKLRVIIDAILLDKLGFTQEQILSAMKKSREYWFYASNETWPWVVTA